jgi:hypothetical protein
MEEDDNYSFSELVDFDEELEVADDNHGSTSSDKETTNEVISEDTINICDLARNIMDDNLDPHVSAEELKLIMNSTVNTKKYERSKDGIELRFFDTIDKFGGDQLRKLSCYAMDGFKQERLFYIKLRGDRTEAKRFILSKCLVKIALKRRNNNTRSIRYGKHLQPTTWEKLMKYLFAIFRQKISTTIILQTSTVTGSSMQC